MNDPHKRVQCEQAYHELLPLLSDYVDLYAIKTPERIALVEHDTGERVTYKRLSQATEAFAAKLLALGLRRGDVVATSLPFTKEHVFLEYACFKLGIIVAPLDLRLRASEIIEAFAAISPKAYFFLGLTEHVDFRPMVEEVIKAASTVRHFVQFQQSDDGVLAGAVHIKQFVRDIKRHYVWAHLTGRLRRYERGISKRDPALIIFTTGSTGRPKPALLCHENILVQNIAVAVNFDFAPGDSVLVNLPPSHVGGQTEQLMTALYRGGTAVLLHVFDAEKSLRAIAEHRVSMCGEIPSLYQMQWRLQRYSSYDLSSLRLAIYGGQGVDRAFLDRLATMARHIGTGMGLTETAGLSTYTPAAWGPAEIAESIGFDSPLCPLSIREPMTHDGAAGCEKPPGELGELCFFGPQVFLGYLNDEAATRHTVSTDGYCYTGDLGRYDEGGLHFAGRAKFVVKPKGYQVFPAEVEDFITSSFADRVTATGCVGAPHEVFGEAIVAFIELREGVSLSVDILSTRLRDIAAYKRPSHVIFLKPGEMPYNRVAKIDTLELSRRAAVAIRDLRAQGGWDQAS